MWAPWQQWLIWGVTRPVAILFWTVSQVLCLFHRRQRVPPVSSSLLLYSATDLARMVRSRKVQCKDVIAAYISRIKEVNPIINAVVQSRFDQALEEAKQIDSMLENTTCTEEELARDVPLLGVPLTVKESIPVKGMSNNAGVPNRSRVAAEDCDAVARLRAKGAIPMLVSNTPELCLSWETYNPVTGRTNNPYNTTRTSGGSSGGEGALLGSGASVIGLGSDIGGSGRIPPSFCGVFGHKPSSGYIDAEDHMPSSDDPLWPTVFVFAPMARYSEDLPLMLSSCVRDESRLKELRLDEPVDLRKLKFFYMESDGSKMTSNVCGDVKSALHKTKAHLESLGVQVKKLDIEEFKHSGQLSFMLLLRMKPCHTIFQKSEDNLTEWRSVLWQSILWLLCLSPHTLHALLYGILKKWFVDIYSEQSIRHMEECKNVIIEKLNNHLGDNGVLLYPAFPDPAHLHMQIYYKQINAAYLSFFNLIDMPVTVFPVMLSRDGLPVGLQAVANRGQDRLTLAVAREMEKAFGGWVPPSGSDMTEVKT